MAEVTVEHRPRLVSLKDGRYVVRCPQCDLRNGQAAPAGIGEPISNWLEAEAILRSHRIQGGQAA
jgi:hypothetical protein